MINIVLWTAGLILLALGLAKVAGPYRRMQELDHLADNAKRYDAWRGGSRTAVGSETTGADVMRQMLRRQTYLWMAVAAVGIALVVAGFVIR